jgi:hypothetical protein
VVEGFNPGLWRQLLADQPQVPEVDDVIAARRQASAVRAELRQLKWSEEPEPASIA